MNEQSIDHKRFPPAYDDTNRGRFIFIPYIFSKPLFAVESEENRARAEKARLNSALSTKDVSVARGCPGNIPFYGTSSKERERTSVQIVSRRTTGSNRIAD